MGQEDYHYFLNLITPENQNIFSTNKSQKQHI